MSLQAQRNDWNRALDRIARGLQTYAPSWGREPGVQMMKQLTKRLAVVSLIVGPVVGGMIGPAAPSGAATALHVVMSAIFETP